MSSNPKQPLVSCVIPTFNRSFSIEKSVKSVLDQTYQNIELIVVDDASSDDTEAKLKKIQDPRFFYVKQISREGASAARNLGISKSKGDFIAFNDSDDLWRPDKIKIQMQQLQSEGAGVGLVVCSSTCFSRDQLTKANEVEEVKKWGPGGAKNAIRRGHSFGSQISLYRKEVLVGVGGFDVKLPRLQDYDLMLRIIEKWNVAVFSDVLVDRFMYADGISQDPRKMLIAMKHVLKKHSQVLAKGSQNRGYFLYKTAKRLANSGETLQALKLLCISLGDNPFCFRAYAGLVYIAFGLTKLRKI